MKELDEKVAIEALIVDFAIGLFSSIASKFSQTKFVQKIRPAAHGDQRYEE